MTSLIVNPAERPLSGHAEVPGDKSIGHRALLLGALASGKVTVRGLGAGEDNRRTRDAMESMGAAVEQVAVDTLVVSGVGLDGLSEPAGEIYCGNSGTSMRLLAGLLAGQRFRSVLTGDSSLSRRPMRRVSAPLEAMGARIRGAPGAREGEIYPPLRLEPVSGGLRGIHYRLPIASAQVKSALLLAGLYATGPTRLTEPGRSRDHTERMLAYLGAPVENAGGGRVTFDPEGWDRKLAARPLGVPGDPSAAAFLIAAALLAGADCVEVPGVCVNERRIGFLDALRAMRARVAIEPRAGEGAEPTATLMVRRGGAGDLTGTVIAGDLTVRSIDELPVLAVVAARARGVTEFRDAAELRVKESDRIATTCAMLRAFGVEVEERRDGFTVQGRPEAPLSAARIDAAGDHRIAMSAVVAGLVADGPVRVDQADNVATSFPGFMAELCKLGADVREEE